jgi:hypothetical protein
MLAPIYPEMFPFPSAASWIRLALSSTHSSLSLKYLPSTSLSSSLSYLFYSLILWSSEVIDLTLSASSSL